MSWYNEAIFYHIYPLGLTGAPKENDYGTPVHRLNTLLPWINHIKEIGCTALYIGPLFEVSDMATRQPITKNWIPVSEPMKISPIL